MTKRLLTRRARRGRRRRRGGLRGSGPGNDVARVAPQASNDGATSLQQELVSVAKSVSPSVVQIETADDLGWRVVFDAGGAILTNAHVVGNANRFVVTLASDDSHPPRPSAGMPRTTWW